MKKKVFSKSMSWVLSVVMVFGILVLQTTVSVSAVNSSTGGFSKNYTITGDGFTDMVNIAMAQNEKTQSQIGYNGSWCAAFVSDCAVLAGQESAIPWNGAVQSMYNAVLNAGGCVISSPQAGDLVFFSSGSGYGHVGIVLDASRNISGNINYNNQGTRLVKILYNQNEGFSSWTFVRPNYKNSPPPDPDPDPITYDYMPVGEKYYLKNNGTGTYMSVDYGVDKQLQNISVYQFTGDAGQQYEIVGSDTDRSYFLRPVLCQSSGRVVNVNGEYTSAGANIMLYNYTGHSTQQWKFRPVSGGYEICSTNNTNYCLAESGTNVQMATYTGASNQIWTLEPVHVHNYTEYVYNSSAHPHYKCYRCSCGDVQENRNEPTYVDTCPECHVHNYTEYVYNWAAHPHYKCYRCSCGDVQENRNEPTYVETCPDCIVEARVDVGTDFYAYLINTYPWKMASVVVDDYSSVRLYGETALSNQFWYFERQSDGSYKIMNVATGKLLDVSASATDNGTDVCVWSDYNGDNQRWYLVAVNGNYVLHPKHAPAMALDVNGGYSDDGTNIQIWNTHNGAAQIFTIYRYGNLPDRPELTLRGNVFEGENVTISWNACSFAHHYQISIWHNGKEEQSFTSQNLAYTFENLSAGDYGICVTAVNQNGSSNVATYDFTVPNYTISPAATGSYSGHTYEYYDTKLTWNQAYKFCEKKGGHLVTINSQEENDFVVDLAKDCSYIWTGGKTSDKTTWYWITGEPFDYQNWSEGEPNDTNGNEDSLEIYLPKTGHNGKWNDTDSPRCSAFVCEYDNKIDSTKYEPVYKENYNGHEYWFFEDSVDWQTAKKICEAKGGYLVIPNNADENAFIQSGIQKTSKEEAWIGFTDIAKEGVWKNVKDHSITYSNWDDGEPNNYLGIEDYAEMYASGKWNDLRGFGENYRSVGFVCEFDDLCTGSGHDYQLTSEKAATCTADGQKVYTCSRCGDTKTEVIKATGHSYTTKVVSPTCTKRGYTVHTCSKCGDSYKDSYVDALGHDYEETVIPPTETEQGYTLHTCKRCGDSYKDNYTDPVPVHLAGDINNDGKVNMKDATRLHQYINGWKVTVVEAALDVNGDGKVNMKDVTRLHQYINGWDVKIFVK